jgi:hypothetical protein
LVERGSEGEREAKIPKFLGTRHLLCHWKATLEDVHASVLVLLGDRDAHVEEKRREEDGLSLPINSVLMKRVEKGKSYALGGRDTSVRKMVALVSRHDATANAGLIPDVKQALPEDAVVLVISFGIYIGAYGINGGLLGTFGAPIVHNLLHNSEVS